VEWISVPEAWIALIILTVLEIVLGVDNIIFIAIMTGRLPEHQRSNARRTGLAMAMITRIGLLFCLTWVMGLTKPLFSILTQEISARDIILISGGMFLILKATLEIHNKIEAKEEHLSHAVRASFIGVIIQIMILDIIFSLDSIITAIGLANQIAVMIIAVIIAVIFMMIFVNAISDFVERHPTIKILALSFLLLVGLALVGEGFDMHIPKGYIYFSMAFSAMVEMINMRIQKNKARKK
jgi:predicted tellurium resistance membrane protein TerC